MPELSPEVILTAIAGVIALGVLAQWLAWRFRLPSILLLLIFGFVAGPVTGALDPAWLQGEWVFAFVSLSIGIILFEGGLTLRLTELREVGRTVLNLVTVGVAVTWLGAGLGAYYLLGFDPALAVLLGAILTVTGPTVIVPLLRYVRPTGRVGTIAKWEGITIDPVGAILAVLVLEAIVFLHEHGTAGAATESAALHAAQGLLTVAVVGVGVSVIGAAILTFLIRRGLLPDHLQNALALGVVVAAFAVSNMLQHESGLVTTTLMGILMANQPYVSVRRLAEFKEDLQVVLIASLFIVLSARLEMSALDYLDGGALLFLAVLIFVVRPLAVAVSSWGTQLNWREWTFLSWLAPRGIVAAAVGALFAFRLRGLFPAEQVEALVPVVFLVIVGTVAVYGLTIAPVARWLGLAQPDPQGVLIVGAHAWARRLAEALDALGFQVLLVDSNPQNVHQARQEGLLAERANILSESVIDELDLAGLGRLLALTPNDEINALAALHFSEIFESAEVYQIATRQEGPRTPGAAQGIGRGQQRGPLPRHLRGRSLFGNGVTFAVMAERLAEGDEVRSFELTEAHPFEEVEAYYRARAQDGPLGGQSGEASVHFLPLFIKRGEDRLFVFSSEGNPIPQPGDTLLALASEPAPGAPWGAAPAEAAPAPEAAPARRDSEDAFGALVRHAPVLDLDEEATYEGTAERVAEALAERLNLPAEVLAERYRSDALSEHVVFSRGAALPHFRLRGIEAPALALVRSRPGLRLPVGSAPGVEAEGDGAAAAAVHALFFLVSPEADPNRHLHMLVHLASRVGQEGFMDAWLAAADAEEIRDALLQQRPLPARQAAASEPAADEHQAKGNGQEG